jgi:pectate lyase
MRLFFNLTCILKKSLFTGNILFFLSTLFLYNANALPAFPGASGAGTNTNHGRGGRVIIVTNLGNSGAGSLRAAIEASGPRIIVFRLAGEIKLSSPLIIRNPNVMIAGQSAPGNGITITGNGMIVATNDVVIRYLRFRPDGWVVGKTDEIDGLQIWPNYPFTPYIRYSYNIVIDHCSLSWASDENMSTNGLVRDTTLSWNIISEGLHTDDLGAGRGLILSPKSERISIHHNLFAHNPQRNPLSRGAKSFDFVNNVIYNWRYEGIGLQAAWSPYGADLTSANIVGNYFKQGANIEDPEIHFYPDLPYGSKFYLRGNIGPRRTNDSIDDWSITSRLGTWYSAPPSHFRTNTRISSLPYVAATSANEALDEVLNESGARYPALDSTDSRIINSVRSGTGRILTRNIGEIGGNPYIPYLDTGIYDSDNDGMTDSWERTVGLNPNNAADANYDSDGDGYTNIEEFLNKTTPTRTTSQNQINNSTFTPAPSAPVTSNNQTTTTYTVDKLNRTGFDLETGYAGRWTKLPESNGVGEVSFNFTGGQGTYDIAVSYLDEDDGISTMTLLVNGATVQSWKLSKNSRVIETTVVPSVPLSSGAKVAVRVNGNNGEMGRILEIELQRGAREDFSQYEGESMTLTNMEVETAPYGQKWVKPRTGATSGAAQFYFLGGTASYDINVASIDEFDGRATIGLDVNGRRVSTWSLTKNTGKRENFTIRQVPLWRGALVRLNVTPNLGEPGRIDYVQFQRSVGGTLQSLNDTTLSKVKLEAQKMTKKGFVNEGNKLVRLKKQRGKGTLETDFSGEPGLYMGSIRLLDEVDGSGKIQIEVDGDTVWRHQLNSKRDRMITKVFGPFSLQPGSRIKIKGRGDNNEMLRLDYLEVFKR